MYYSEYHRFYVIRYLSVTQLAFYDLKASFFYLVRKNVFYIQF